MAARHAFDVGMATAEKGVPALPASEMEHIRRVYDEDVGSRKFGAVATPREDAQMARAIERHAVPCECIIELYELLWRWGHRNTEHRGFASSFGFSIPDTVVIMKGKIYAWYFISKKDGAMLRKSENQLGVMAVQEKFCKSSSSDADKPYCAVWMPMASQFPEARCHSPHAEFQSVTATRHFLSSLRITHSGVLQLFVEPTGVSNFLVRTVQFRKQTSLSVRTNRSLLNKGKGPLFDRAATFEGWAGLSSTSGRYRSHKHPHMEQLILAAGETLNLRIEQERVRQMLFLGPTQHVALHFKVAKDDMLYLIYASVVTEKEVILQTRPQLLMGDACMTESIPLASLLPGGTDKRAAPYEAPSCVWREQVKNVRDEWLEGNGYLDLDELEGNADREGERAGSLPPMRRPLSVGASASAPLSARGTAPRRPSSERRHHSDPDVQTILPRMNYARPQIPDVPYQFQALQHSLDEAGRYEYPPPFMGNDCIKRPLVAQVPFDVSASTALRQHLGSAAAENITPRPPSASRLSSGSTGGPGRPPLPSARKTPEQYGLSPDEVSTAHESWPRGDLSSTAGFTSDGRNSSRLSDQRPHPSR